METVTVKSSTVYIALGGQLDVYRSLEEVPPSMRRRLDESTNGANSATILIADRNGQRELVRAIEGQPTPLRVRVRTSRMQTSTEPSSAEQEKSDRPWLELGIIGLLGLVAWLVFLWK
jgi:hypothetical protein